MIAARIGQLLAYLVLLLLVLGVLLLLVKVGQSLARVVS